MKDHYDFSQGTRGKFYQPEALFRMPIYLDERIQAVLTVKAKDKGMELSDLVNDLLRREIETIEAVK